MIPKQRKTLTGHFGKSSDGAHVPSRDLLPSLFARCVGHAGVDNGPVSIMPKFLMWPAVLVAVAVAVATTLLLLLSSPEEQTPTSALVEPSVPSAVPARAPSVDFGRMPPDHGTWASVSPRTTGPPVIPQDEPPAAPWETAINRLLDSQDENDKVAAALAAMLPTLPPEGKLEAVQHMVTLLYDEQYHLAIQLLLDPALHPDLREVVFMDILDRPHKVQLPVLLALLGTPGHPLHGETRRVLQEVVGIDFGSDPAAWNAAVQALMAKEATEESNREAYAEEWP